MTAKYVFWLYHDLFNPSLQKENDIVSVFSLLGNNTVKKILAHITLCLLSMIFCHRVNSPGLPLVLSHTYTHKQMFSTKQWSPWAVNLFMWDS